MANTNADPFPGRIIDENGEVVNLVTLLGGGSPVPGMVRSPSQYDPVCLRLVAEDGRVYNLADLIENGGGGSQKDELPEAGEDQVGKIYQYTGASGGGLLHGHFYECVASGQTYAWVEINLAPDGAENHNFAFDGKDLTDSFADADALWTALSAENYEKIHLGDYWPVTLNGDFRDYGMMTCQQGQTYYSDTELTTEAGSAAQDYSASPVGDGALPGSHKPYCEVTIGGVKYYCKYADCLPYLVRTLSNAVMKFEAMPNVYWRYGDSGSQNFQNGRPHILFSPRDGLPTTLKMRKCNETWEDQHIDEFTGDGTTTEFTLSGTVGTIGYVFVDGVKKAYNTDYTYASNKITFKANKQPASGALVQVEWMEGTTPWNGSALYKTFNDPDHGILKLIQQADEKLYNHLYKGPNSKGMRYYGETRTKTGQQGGSWQDRGILFLPTEDEIWGRWCRTSGADGACNMQQWPIYQLGGRRHFAKGAGNGASRYGVWCASSTSVTAFAHVNTNGNPNYNNATIALVAAPCFIFCEAPS